MKLKTVIVSTMMAFPVVTLAQTQLTPTGNVKGISARDVELNVHDSRTRTSKKVGNGKLKNNKFTIKASITIACGCVISKGGTWNADDFAIKAVIHHNGRETGMFPLNYAGVWNNFETEIPIQQKGDSLLDEYVFDLITGNTGLDRINFTII